MNVWAGPSQLSTAGVARVCVCVCARAAVEGCVCVWWRRDGCVCVRAGMEPTPLLCVCVCTCAAVEGCVCVYVCARREPNTLPGILVGDHPVLSTEDTKS